MVTVQNRVGWEATLYIWWAVSWRLVLAVFAIERLDETLAAIPGIMKAVEDSPFLFFTGRCAVSWWASLWAMRAGLQDRYATFVFVAETKGGDNLFLYGNRLPIGVAVRVWLTYTWRTAVAPIAILIGTVTAAAIEHQNITDAIVTLESDQWVYFTASAGMVTSIWAMRESLADRYGSFRFSTYPKSVPV